MALAAPAARVACPACVSLAAAFVVMTLGGCYEHVTKSDPTSMQGPQEYQRNVEEEGPSWLNELMWGPPPKGEDPVAYYRRKNSYGLSE